MRWETLNDGFRILAPAKLNLYLEVGAPRADGFHEIDSILQTVTLFDELELHRSAASEIILEEDGIAAGENYLVHRAALLLQERLFREGSGRPKAGARISLKKRIPQGGGLGGGSSDAAATLLGLSRLWGEAVSPALLEELAAGIGSDVPFFLAGGSAHCQGRGEKVRALGPAFDEAEPFHYVLAYPRFEISTRFVYDALDARRGNDFVLTAREPLATMTPASIHRQLARGTLFFNRLESVVYSAFPEMEILQATMVKEPFLKVLLSGSGSTVFGVCPTAESAERIGEDLAARLSAEVFTVRSERPGVSLSGSPALFGRALGH
jgi:4-diphosphocytidyl-2-C-methyl-D-erythritol kinase